MSTAIVLGTPGDFYLQFGLTEAVSPRRPRLTWVTAKWNLFASHNVPLPAKWNLFAGAGSGAI